VADVIRLDIHTLNLASLDHECITLASVSAKERGGRELEVESAGEVAAGVTKEADTTALLGIKRLAPGSGPGRMLAFRSNLVWNSRAIHEGVVDGDNEDLAGVLDLGVLDVAGNVGVGAGWAWVVSAQGYISIP
jgi:hypothetical protein